MRLRVVSCPAMSSSMHSPISSSSVSGPPASCTLVSAEIRSPPGECRRDGSSPRRYAANSSRAARCLPRSSSETRKAGSKALARASDQATSSGRSAGGMPSSSLITATGNGSARPEIRSNRPPGPGTALPSSSAVSASTRGVSSLTRAGVKARDTSRRSRVWSGGFSASIDRAATPPSTLRAGPRPAGRPSPSVERPNAASASTASQSANRLSTYSRSRGRATGRSARHRAYAG